MPARISFLAAVAMCDTLVDRFDVGAGTAVLQIYEGAMPATINDAPLGNVLVEFALPNPSFGDAAVSATGGTAVAEDIAPVPALTSGEASWFRILDADGVPQLDGDVSVAGGTGQLQLTSLTVVEAVDVSVYLLSITQRAS
mgnify:CR=1 FL=1